MAWRKPAAMDNTPTSTATTPAIPMTVAATAPRRCGRLINPNFVIEATCDNQFKSQVIKIYIRLKASATRNRMAWRAGKIPVIKPKTRQSPSPMNKSRTGK